MPAGGKGRCIRGATTPLALVSDSEGEAIIIGNGGVLESVHVGIDAPPGFTFYIRNLGRANSTLSPIKASKLYP